MLTLPLFSYVVEIFLLLLSGHVVANEGILGVAPLLDFLLSALLIGIVVLVFLLFVFHVIREVRRTLRELQRQAVKDAAREAQKRELAILDGEVPAETDSQSPTTQTQQNSSMRKFLQKGGSETIEMH